MVATRRCGFGSEEMRVRQEMILGIGGMRALKALGISPTVCHMNEGHAAFLSLERLAQFREKYGCDLKTARKSVVSGNVFTTHTPVPAGFDKFHPDLLERYLAKTVAKLDLPMDEFIRLGRIHRENAGEAFNMAVLAMENANHINGVSKLHAKVSREMFKDRWPQYPVEEVPVDAITNGIHTMTWMSRRMVDLIDRHLGPGWRSDASSGAPTRRRPKSGRRSPKSQTRSFGSFARTSVATSSGSYDAGCSACSSGATKSVPISEV